MSENEALKSPSEFSPAAPSAPVENSPVLSQTAEMVEGKVAEITPRASETAQSQNPGGATTQSTQSKQDDALLSDRELLKKHLLSQAPKERVMREQAAAVLEKEKVKLESQIEQYRKKKQYHLLSAAIMKLRQVVREIEDLARMSFEQLKEAWLKIVHKFA